MALRIIDISSWQNVRDWQAVKDSGIDGVVVKATGGTFYANPRYAAQLAGARAVGLLVGHYHYLYEGVVNGADPVAEARYFHDINDVLPGEPLAGDLEEPTAWDGVAAFTLAWLQEVERLSGVRPILYTYKSYIAERLLADEPKLAEYVLWYAYYRDPIANHPMPEAPAPWKEIGMWQWSAFETIPGIGPNVDEDAFPGTAADFRALGGAVAIPPAPLFVNPDPLTGVWVHEYFGHIFDLAHHGHPLQPAFLRTDGMICQLFENCAMESNGRGEPRIAGIGQALVHMTGNKFPDWPDVHPLV